MLSVVDLPQPLGPTSVRNSRSFTVRFRSFKAATAPNRLLTRSKRISAMGYPFTAPKVRPRTRYFCMAAEKIITGTIIIVPSADISPQRRNLSEI
jgi:hypothetical protein